jgi:signal transduction histidine kinase
MIFINLFKENNILILKIKDNAGGIKEDILDRVFEPYFTTKHKSQGTGIGLYMSTEIIKKHMNGNLTVSNQEYTYNNIKYNGAEFKIEIPIN